MAFSEAGTWTAPDGARLALRHAPAHGAQRAALILLHGWGEHAAPYAEAADWLAARGIGVWAVDQRGHGRSQGRRGHIERFSQYLSDVAALRRFVGAQASVPQLLLGVSFGGFITLRYLETAPDDLAGAVAVVPYVRLARRPAAWKVGLARLLGDVLPVLPVSTGIAWSDTTRNEAVVRAFVADPLAHQRMTPRAWQEAQRALAVLHAECDRIGVPVLFLLAGDDRIVSTAAAEAFARRLHAPVTLRTYASMYHNLFYEPGREAVFADLARWLDSVLGTTDWAA